MLFSDFRAYRPISLPAPPIVALTVFLCRCTHYRPSIAGIVIFNTFTVNVSLFFYGYYICHDLSPKLSAPVFKVPTWNVAICIVHLHFGNFCFSLSSVTDFSNTRARATISAGRAPFLPARRAVRFGQVVCVRVMIIIRWLCFYSHL